MISAPFHRFSSVRFLSLEARHDQTLFANLSLKAMVSFFTSHSQSPILLINLMINHFSVWCWRGATSTATEYNSIILWEQAPALAPVWEPSELQAQRLCAQSAIAVRDSRGERQLQIQNTNTTNTTTTNTNTTMTTTGVASTKTADPGQSPILVRDSHWCRCSEQIQNTNTTSLNSSEIPSSRIFCSKVLNLKHI